MVNGGPYAKLLPLKNGHYRRVVDPKIPYCIDDSTIYEEGSYSNDSTNYPNSVSGIFNTPVYNDYNKGNNKLEDYSYYHPTATFGSTKRTGLFTCCNDNADLYSAEGLADSSQPEVHPASPRLADSSSNYLSLKSRATPGDRGDVRGVEDVTSSGKPGSDPRELEGEVNKMATTASGNDRTTSGRESDGKMSSDVRMDNKASCKLHIGGDDVVKCDMLLCNCSSNSNVQRLSSDNYERLGMVLDEGIMPMVLENDKKSIVDNTLTSKLSLIYKDTSDYFLKACKYICYVDEDYYNELFPGSILYTDETSDFNFNPEERTPPEVTALSSTCRSTRALPTRRGASPNYLSLKGEATPGDRGDDNPEEQRMSTPKNENILPGRTKYVNTEERNLVNGPQVEPGSDLRELEGEINRRADGRNVTSGGSCLQDKDRTSSRGVDGRSVSLDGEATSVFYRVSGNADSSLDTKLSSVSTIIHVSEGIVSSSPSFNDEGISAPKFKTTDEIRLEKFGLEVDYNMEDDIFKTVGVNVLFYTKSRIVPTLLYLSIDNNKNVIYLTKKNISRFFPIKLINKIIISKNIILNEFQEQINDDPLIKLDCMMAFNAANFTNSVAIQFTNPIIKDKFIANIRYLKSEINGDTLEPL